METYITICKQNLLYRNAKFAHENLLYVSGNSNRVSVSTQRGGVGREMGGRFKRERINVYLWLLHAEV